MTSKKPDFKKANVLANEILVASSTLQRFPVNTKKTVHEWSDVAVVTFKKAHDYEIDIEAFGSNSAVLQCKYGRYIIFYNQNDYKPRVRFSILHEFGHYKFQHKLGKCSEEEYRRAEVEANCFAAQILMPEQVLIELNNRGALITVDFLVKNFGVSEEAAKKRIDTMGKINYEWRSNDEKIFDESILFKYKDFIDSIMPKNNKYNYYEYEYDRQQERDDWEFDTRTRYR